MSQDDQTGFLPPMLMFRSFLTLASGYVLHIFAGVLITLAVGNLMFPDRQPVQPPATNESQVDPASKEQTEAKPDAPADDAKTPSPRETPRSMMMVVLALSGLVNFFIGAYVVRTAPFSHQTHSIFLAVILFVSYLQRSISETPDKKSMTLITMVVCSAAVFLGGRWMAQRLTRLYWENDNAEPADE